MLFKLIMISQVPIYLSSKPKIINMPTNQEGLVEAGQIRNLQTSLGITNGTLYHDVLKGSFDGDSYPIQLRAVIRFEVADFQNIEDKMGPVWWGDVVAD